MPKILPTTINNPETTHLNLSNYELDSIPDDIFLLENLTVLNLDHNEISKIPPEIGKLKNLRVLTLSHNKLGYIPSQIGLLCDLRYLKLSHNKLSELPKEIRFLYKIRRLELGENKFTKFPKITGQLKELRRLNLSGAKFHELPAAIGNLSNLKELDLSDGNLTEIIPAIAKFFNLRKLSLSRNQLKKLPVQLKELEKLKYLDLRKNRLPIPPEIVQIRNEPKTILDYYFDSVWGKRSPLNEVKLIFIGQGSIGKTSLVNRITHDTFSFEQSKTDGISISQWKIPDRRKPLHSEDDTVSKQSSTITVNIWDFGGQEIMHATHQFFLTKRSLYILVLDARLTQEENRVEYWLKIIQSYGSMSPVLIVGNKTDQHPLDVDRTGLKKKYPNIIDIVETSAATGDGIEHLKESIINKINRLRYVRDLLPEAWFTVKTTLEDLRLDSNFIAHEKYLELCVGNKVNDERSQRTLIGFLHDLGVVLHFQDEPRLRALGILNPQWVTNGVYKIINSHALFHNKGVLTISMLDEILNLPEYPHSKRLFIIDMMKKFELCYDLESDRIFLVPDLLPKNESLLSFSGVPAFEYAYPVLPSSIITRFIVRMNKKIDDGFVWRTGVVLKIGENKALVKADIEDRKITIAIDGVEYSRRDALSAIRYELGEIHNSIKGLNPQQRVPVPNAPLAEPLKYEYLLKLERAGQETVLVENGNDLVTVNVRQMLSAIESEAQRREQQGNVINNIYVGGNVSGNLVIGDKNEVIQNSYNKIKSADISPELKETMKQLAEAVDAMIQKLPAEQAAEVAEDFGKLADEAVKPKPNQKWYSVSIEGLIKAAENLDKLGIPVINLSRKVLSLLTG
jgi:internalin A